MADLIREKDFGGGRRFQLVSGDLLGEPVEAIVNAANGFLAHGGGVAGAIARAAGEALVAESAAIVRKNGPLATGTAAMTGAGKLPFRGVIHAVGPRWGEGEEEEKLISALVAAFTVASRAGMRSLSFPAVSSGIFAVPLEVCARAYLAAVERFFLENPETVLKTIRLCLLPGPLLDLLGKQWPMAP